MKEIIIATKNPGKAKEFAELFEPYGYQVKTLLDFPDSPDIEETGTTFKENAILKAEGIAAILNKIVIADDSGLSIDALNGQPGVYSARYAGEEKNDQNNIQKVLVELEGVPTAERTARFECALALKIPGKPTVVVHGTCEGIILTETRGDQGFGYDPIFYVPEKGKTMAQMNSDEKNRISHRGNAIRKLQSWVENNLSKEEF